ncbi:MAG TPA: acyl-CoA thioesterase [Bacteroidia bacterium]|nr:acyl-CoA thioesterase [Bacteroidia bacterium]
MKSKTPKESYAISTHLVLPNETNLLGNLMGGRLLHWMDITAAIAAHRHSQRVVVTASVNHVSFEKAIRLGDYVTIEAKVSRAFNTSMEVFLDVTVETGFTGEKIKSNDATYVFVAVDQVGKPIEIPQLTPETQLEKERYATALQRRQLSLLLAGKIDPDDAPELKELFISKKHK